MHLFCGHGGRVIEKTVGVIKARMKPVAGGSFWSCSIAPCWDVLTFQWRTLSRRWNARLGVNRWMEEAKVSNMGTAYCIAGGFLAVISVNCLSLLAGSAMKAWLQKDGQNGWESASDIHHEFAQCGEEPHFYFWLISALLEKTNITRMRERQMNSGDMSLLIF